MADAGIAGVLQRLQSDDLSVFPFRCVVMRNRNASCMRCAEACTSGAIAVTADELSVDSDLCVGCGTCATVCPTCALEARHPNDAVLDQQVRAALVANEGRAVVVCQAMWDAHKGAIDPAKATCVTCLGRVEESVLVGLAAAGAQSIALVHGDCATCARNVGMETYVQVAECANLLLDVWDAPVRVELREKLPASIRAAAPVAGAGLQEQASPLGYDASRRAFFGDAGRLGAEVVAGAMADLSGAAEAAEQEAVNDQVIRYMKVMNDGTLPHFVPDRRERLLDALAELGEPRDAALETRLWGRVVIDPAQCKTCWMCTTFCPTGAISRYREDGHDVGVEHVPADCVKCRCCEDVCPTGALVLHEDVMAREVVAGEVAERFELPRVTDDRGGPHSMYGALKKIVKCDQFYER